MIEKYKSVTIANIEDNCTLDKLYSELLNQKYQFLILNTNHEKYVLTKERSIIKIEHEKQFIDAFNKDIYYKTVIKNKNVDLNEQDFNIYNAYIMKFKDQLTEKRYNDQYYFGCVAVKTDNGFITTVRGKQNLEEYTIVENVDHKHHIIHVIYKKATLNAPLLDYLFQNKSVKVIVHLHQFNDDLPYYDYAFPGTVKDTVRSNTTSFNICHHGVVYMFDQNGNIL